MEEKRIEKLGVCMKTFADLDRQVLPIVGKCLDGMTSAAESIEPKTVSRQIQKSTQQHMGLLLTQARRHPQPTPSLPGSVGGRCRNGCKLRRVYNCVLFVL